MGASFKYGLYTLSANQTSNLSVGDHIEWDTSQGSLGGLSTGSGQQKGIITLPANGTYKITGQVAAENSTSNSFAIRVYNRTASSWLGVRALGISQNYNVSVSEGPSFLAIITTTEETDIDVRIEQGSYVNTVYDEYAWVLIEEYGGY